MKNKGKNKAGRQVARNIGPKYIVKVYLSKKNPTDDDLHPHSSSKIDSEEHPVKSISQSSDTTSRSEHPVVAQEAQAQSGEQTSAFALTQKDRVPRPSRFVGDAGDDAFKRLFDRLKGSYLDTTYENFAGLFRVVAVENQRFFPIKWIRDGRGLQCFLEALYRADVNVPATGLEKAKLSKIFLVNDKPFDIGKNSLYCWGKGKTIDPENTQEGKIREFYDLITMAISPPSNS